MTYRIDPDVVWMAEDGEVRLYEPESGEFQTLNSTATELWLLISEGRSAEDITAEVGRRYGAEDPEQLAEIGRDVTDFLARLTGQGLVVKDGAGGTDGTVGATGPEAEAGSSAGAGSDAGAGSEAGSDAGATSGNGERRSGTEAVADA
ncbi:PqqD family protein [Streptomyces sp. NPDC020965]|uniref:PqqD family protein n=1 Tax=Streptomyces sp. NPDC020965 TaxID=3365105 RepID=UPI0037B7B825